MRISRYIYIVLAVEIIIIISPSRTQAYSVLTHLAVIDSAWTEGIQPVLLHRFPDATPEDLRRARAYAYGGSLIQDLGYTPISNKFFGNLVHYVRTGDFIMSLINNSTTLEEYAFALGALSHYCSDVHGHSIGINPSVPLLYPKLARYGRASHQC